MVSDQPSMERYVADLMKLAYDLPEVESTLTIGLNKKLYLINAWSLHRFRFHESPCIGRTHRIVLQCTR